MNCALIFAGGSGKRMNSKSRPKQFLELHSKEIIIYTIEHFEKHPDIDAIVVVCIEGWIEYLKKALKKNGIEKVLDISLSDEEKVKFINSANLMKEYIDRINTKQNN